MSIINENNEKELTSLLQSIDSIVLKDKSLVEEVATDEILKLLIAKSSGRIDWLLDTYNQNVIDEQILSASGGLLSEIEFSKEKIKLISRDLLVSYSLYKTYQKVAEARNLEVIVNDNIQAVETILVENGLLEKQKQL